MEIRESFVVPASMSVVWDFFEDINRVSSCVPGLQSLTVLNADEYKVVIKEKLGYFSATFEINTRREQMERFRFMQFSSVGRTVKGSVGNLRSKDRVDFVAVDDSTTRVDVFCEPALGGMLGAVGHKMILSKSRAMTEQFAGALCAALGGSKDMDAAAAAAEPAPAAADKFEAPAVLP
jgi:carbon monoxide dehydrogenase subunit G